MPSLDSPGVDQQSFYKGQCSTVALAGCLLYTKSFFFLWGQPPFRSYGSVTYVASFCQKVKEQLQVKYSLILSRSQESWLIAFLLSSPARSKWQHSSKEKKNIPGYARSDHPHYRWNSMLLCISPTPPWSAGRDLTYFLQLCPRQSQHRRIILTSQRSFL